MGLPRARLSPECNPILLNYLWPGNVRELEHCISRALLKARGEYRVGGNSIISIRPQHLDISHDQLQPASGHLEGCTVQETLSVVNEQEFTLKEGIDQFQRLWIAERLKDNDGNQAKTARQLGINRSNFYRLLKRLELR